MFARRTATRIKKGTVQKKNRHTLTPNYGIPDSMKFR